MFRSMEAQCHCGAASRGPVKNVMAYMRDHNCPAAEVEELDSEPEHRVGFQPNPVD